MTACSLAAMPIPDAPLRYDGPAHLLTLAPTRAGKGVGTVIPTLLLVHRPMLVIEDPAAFVIDRLSKRWQHLNEAIPTRLR